MYSTSKALSIKERLVNLYNESSEINCIIHLFGRMQPSNSICAPLKMQFEKDPRIASMERSALMIDGEAGLMNYPAQHQQPLNILVYRSGVQVV